MTKALYQKNLAILGILRLFKMTKVTKMTIKMTTKMTKVKYNKIKYLLLRCLRCPFTVCIGMFSAREKEAEIMPNRKHEARQLMLQRKAHKALDSKSVAYQGKTRVKRPSLSTSMT